MVDELYHHGVKGMKWGVRRYQNEDGSYTQEGKERRMYANRARRSAKTKKDIDALYNTLSRKDKKLLNGGSELDDDTEREWLSIEAGEFVVKRFLNKDGNTPVSALDIMTTTKNGHLAVAIMTNPNYRGSGEASKLAKKATKWFDNNAHRYGATTLDWAPYYKNKASIRVAEKSGFEREANSGNDKIVRLHYKPKRRNN